tara:strand:- start:563 stop:1195 length:633 start_codon:yes stop_codon:yes gene_type:complete
MNLILATNNQEKIIEFRRILRGYFSSMEGIDIFGIKSEPDENGMSFSENAKIKLDFYLDKIKEIKANEADLNEYYIMSEDSGIEIDALDGNPGIRSARYGHPDMTSPERNKLVLHRLKDTSSSNRKARFVCYIRFSDFIAEGHQEFSGQCEGKISKIISGKNGFGYDPIFTPLGYNKSMANLSDNEKDKISHRGRACEGLINYLFKNREN